MWKTADVTERIHRLPVPALLEFKTLTLAYKTATKNSSCLPELPHSGLRSLPLTVLCQRKTPDLNTAGHRETSSPLNTFALDRLQKISIYMYIFFNQMHLMHTMHIANGTACGLTGQHGTKKTTHVLLS